MIAWLRRLFTPAAPKQKALSGVDSRGWFSLFSFDGVRRIFQTDEIEIKHESVLSQWTVFACMTLIASDIGKLRMKLVEQIGGIWTEVQSPTFSSVLRKPNHFQTWQKFIEQWILSLLSRGNTYVLKVRDRSRRVVALYVLDPMRVRPLVSTVDGSVYYSLCEDDLNQVFTSYDGSDALPASEIIHDRINCIFHPLVGLSPIFACGLAATKALKVEKNASRFFANNSQPGGVLTAPAEISDETAKRLKEYFETNFTGDNAGKVAVLGDGLRYEAMSVNAVDAELIKQLQISAEAICACFHVPAYMVGAAAAPASTNVEALNLQYYSQCLQALMESIENFLDDGLGLGKMTDGRILGTEFDLDGLLKMDSAARMEVLARGVEKAIISPNEARATLNRPKKAGGDSLYLQQQNFSTEALSKRDAGPDPFGTGTSAPAPIPVATPTPADDQTRAMLERIEKALPARGEGTPDDLARVLTQELLSRAMRESPLA